MENELLHYGVPGMKWGQRKQYQSVGNAGGNGRSGGSSGNTKPQDSEEYRLKELELKNQLKAEKMRNRTERGKTKTKKILAVLGGVSLVGLAVALNRLAKKKGALVENNINSKNKTDNRQDNRTYEAGSTVLEKGAQVLQSINVATGKGKAKTKIKTK